MKVARNIINIEKEHRKSSNPVRDIKQKYLTPEFSGTLEEQRDQINEHITELLRGEIPEASNIEVLVKNYSSLVADKEAQIRERLSGIFY